jgi:uncharacterized protein YegJ (DUF2314 family)
VLRLLSHCVVSVCVLIAFGCASSEGEGGRAQPNTRNEAPAPESLKVTFTLEDAQQRHRENPDTFEIPSEQELEKLAPSWFAKLIFKINLPDDEPVERMWVLIKERNGDRFVGGLENDPVSTDALKSGERVEFELRHIIDVMSPGD